MVLLSTHIVEDIAQTCRDMAVLGRGRVIYRGTVGELTARASGRVWMVLGDGSPPSVGTVVSVLPQADGTTRYRIVAGTPPAVDAEPIAPTLEDGYIALAQQHRAVAEDVVADPIS